MKDKYGNLKRNEANIKKEIFKIGGRVSAWCTTAPSLKHDGDCEGKFHLPCVNFYLVFCQMYIISYAIDVYFRQPIRTRAGRQCCCGQQLRWWM